MELKILNNCENLIKEHTKNSEKLLKEIYKVDYKDLTEDLIEIREYLKEWIYADR